jgi:hypothetical protein
MTNPGDHSFPTNDGAQPGPVLGGGKESALLVTSGKETERVDRADSLPNPIAEGKIVIMDDNENVLRYNDYRNLMNALRWDRRYRVATMNGAHGLMERASQFIRGWHTKMKIMAHMNGRRK